MVIVLWLCDNQLSLVFRSLPLPVLCTFWQWWQCVRLVAVNENDEEFCNYFRMWTGCEKDRMWRKKILALRLSCRLYLHIRVCIVRINVCIYVHCDVCEERFQRYSLQSCQCIFIRRRRAGLRRDDILATAAAAVPAAVAPQSCSCNIPRAEYPNYSCSSSPALLLLLLLLTDNDGRRPTTSGGPALCAALLYKHDDCPARCWSQAASDDDDCGYEEWERNLLTLLLSCDVLVFPPSFRRFERGKGTRATGCLPFHLLIHSSYSLSYYIYTYLCCPASSLQANSFHLRDATRRILRIFVRGFNCPVLCQSRVYLIWRLCTEICAPKALTNYF